MKQTRDLKATVIKHVTYFFRWLQPKRMAGRLFAVILVIGFFLSIILSTIVAVVAGNMIYNEAQNRLDNQAVQTINVFDQQMEVLQNIAITASRQSYIQKLLEDDHSGFESYLVVRNSYNYLKHQNDSYERIHLYVIVNSKRYILSSKPSDVSGDFHSLGIHQSEWYVSLENSDDMITYLSDFVPPRSSFQEQFAIALRIRDIYSWQTLGYILVAIEKQVLHDMIRETLFESDGHLVVLNQKGNVAFQSAGKTGAVDVNSQIIDPFDASRLIHTLEQKQTTGGEIEEYDRFYLSYKQSNQTQWSFLAFVDRQTIRFQILSLQLIIIGVVTISMIVLIVVAKQTAKIYVRPINHLINFIHSVEGNAFRGQIDIYSDDEVGDLASSFNTMIDSVRKNQILRNNAEIQALEKQINPHFLFNTFESIKGLAIKGETDQTVAMIEKLSDNFRYVINREGTQWVTIEDELNHVRNYLAIQKVRFSDRLSVVFSIDPSILNVKVPRFILQPIVENSIEHSLDQKEDTYCLEIRGYTSNQDICFTIKDNGDGIDTHVLSDLIVWINQSTDHETDNKHQFGIGLRNINERLIRFFGESYRLSIESKKGTGTAVSIHLPINNRSESGALT